MNPLSHTRQNSDSPRTEIAESVSQLHDCVGSLWKLQHETVIPAICQVPTPTQDRLNTRVLRSLGLKARLHLVGMYQALDDIEMQTFCRAIPKIPQRLLPRWKRNLYDPVAGVMDAFQ